MASETIYGYFGKKGAGKTHELIRVILQRLREGRYVVAVIPQLDVEKVASYLKDPTVKDRLVVADYTEVESNENFFPDEDLLRRLQMWKRGDPIPEDAHKWCSSTVIPGCFLAIDEAWRWLENKKTIPPRLKAALHMARHWQGPECWNKPELIAKFRDPSWFPMMGGPEFDTLPVGMTPTIFPEQWEQLADGSFRRFRGGDGTQLCTANILFASQDFFGLERSLRAQIDQCTQLVSIRDSYFPSLLKKATDGKEQYMSYTFEAADMPSRRQMLSAMEKNEKLWLAEECVTHDPAIHELKAYTAGYAKENRVDNKADLKNNPHWLKIKRQGYVMLALFAGALGLAAWTFSGLGGSDELVSQSSGASVAGTVGGSSSARAAASAPPVEMGFAGKVGNMLILEADGHHKMIDRTAATVAAGGRYLISIDGRTIDSGTDLAAPHSSGDAGSGNDGAGHVVSHPGRSSPSSVSADTVRALSNEVKSSTGGAVGG